MKPSIKTFFFAITVTVAASLSAFGSANIDCVTTAIVSTVVPEFREALAHQSEKIEGLIVTRLRHLDYPRAELVVTGVKPEDLKLAYALFKQSGVDFELVKYRASTPLRYLTVGCGTLGCAIGVLGAAARVFNADFTSFAATLSGIASALTVGTSVGARIYDRTFFNMNSAEFWQNFFRDLRTKIPTNSNVSILLLATEPQSATALLKKAGFMEDARSLEY